MFRTASANGTRINMFSKGYKILEYISENKGATKYEVLTQALGKVGTKQRLRGYYSVYFADYVYNGLLTLDNVTHKYHITELGRQRIVEASIRTLYLNKSVL